MPDPGTAYVTAFRIGDAILDLGPATDIGKMFVSFQQYLY
jgi:hypothetical protein